MSETEYNLEREASNEKNCESQDEKPSYQAVYGGISRWPNFMASLVSQSNFG